MLLRQCQRAVKGLNLAGGGSVGIHPVQAFYKASPVPYENPAVIPGVGAVLGMRQRVGGEYHRQEGAVT